MILNISTLTFFDNTFTLIGLKAATGKSRFGDCLCIIYIANYAAFKYKIPVIYQNFCYSNELKIQHDIDNFKNVFKRFKIVRISDESQIDLNTKEETLYEIRMDFFCKHYLQADKIEQVREKFRELIKPIQNFSLPCLLDKNRINIAVHVRRGGGFDLPLLSKDGLFDNSSDAKNYKTVDALDMAKKCEKTFFFYSDQRWPYKFPPDSFYVEQIRNIANMFPNKKIHVHIFTDDLNPIKILEKYKKVLENYDITFSCRQKDNHHTKNVVEDFFAMTKFDCLIRPTSSYTHIAQLIGNFKVVILPKHGTWVQKDKLVIDEVTIIKDGKLI